jgi:RimJ/RimL family protein N-acetyltransferase
MTASAVRLEPWGADGLELLNRLLGDPAMMDHLGGPESTDKIATRQARYQRPDSGQFAIVLEETGEAVGYVGFWDREWREAAVLEMGWSVLPEHHGRGIAGRAASLALARGARDSERSYVHAFPSVDNAASNAICGKAGFVLLGAVDFEYPPGHEMRCHDWRFDLRDLRGG